MLLAERRPLNMRPRLPTAVRLNALSGVRWNKVGWERESRQTKGGGLKGIEMTKEAGLFGMGL